MSEEKWFQPLKPWVTFLKLRASVGLVGNDRPINKDLRFLYTPDPYEVNNSGLPNRNGGYAYSFGIENGTASLGARESSKNNANVGWETALKQNYGVDMNFLTTVYALLSIISKNIVRISC